MSRRPCRKRLRSSYNQMHAEVLKLSCQRAEEFDCGYLDGELDSGEKSGGRAAHA